MFTHADHKHQHKHQPKGCRHQHPFFKIKSATLTTLNVPLTTLMLAESHTLSIASVTIFASSGTSSATLNDSITFLIRSAPKVFIMESSKLRKKRLLPGSPFGRQILEILKKKSVVELQKKKWR
jgi:hypothetical protein